MDGFRNNDDENVGVTGAAGGMPGDPGVPSIPGNDETPIGGTPIWTKDGIPGDEGEGGTSLRQIEEERAPEGS